jgi:hypothetical protein
LRLSSQVAQLHHPLNIWLLVVGVAVDQGMAVEGVEVVTGQHQILLLLLGQQLP